MEKDIINGIKKEIVASAKFEEAIISALEIKNCYKKRKVNFIALVASLLLIFILSQGGVYAYRYMKFHANNQWGYIMPSLEESIEGGYLYNVDMNYVYNNKVGIKINYIIMSDYHLNVLFEIVGRQVTDLQDMLIYDEDYNILFCYDIDIYQEFCKLHGKNNSMQQIEQYANGYGIQIIENEENKIQILYTIRSTSGFPKSKNLYFSCHNLYYEGLKIESGTWNIALELPEKFYNRENIQYKGTVTENSIIEWGKAEITDTDMLLKVKLKEGNRKSNIDIYILDEQGKKYNYNQIENSIYVYNNIVYANFNIRKEDFPSTMIAVISIDNEKIYMELEKEQT